MTSYRRGDDVAEVVAPSELGDTVYLSLLPDGGIRILPAGSATIWLEATAGGDLDSVVQRVADTVSLEADAIRADVETFVSLLVDEGFLTRR